MDMSALLRLLPTAEMIAEELFLLGWDCTSCLSDPKQTYTNVRLYTGQTPLESDVLYALKPGETRFPSDTFSYICTTPVPGSANHICCPEQRPEALLEALLDLFARCRQAENRIDQLVYRNGSLQELCDLGSEMLENPVFIHDDWFIFIAISQREQVLVPEYVQSSGKAYVPRAYVDSFKHDSDYLKTYSYPDAQLWLDPDGNPTTLYVNLWDGTVYRGRLLVVQNGRAFHKADYLLAELLTQRAILLLRRTVGSQKQHRGMDDIVYELLAGKLTAETDLALLLNALNWRSSDRYLCIRVRAQQHGPDPVMEHMLHSDLFPVFPGSYILSMGQEQCVILNMRCVPTALTQLHHILAPLCRDYCLYAGISSPVAGIREVHLSYYQAGVALDQAFSRQSEQWILFFRDCTLEHMLSSMDSPLTPRHLVSPDLYTLMKHDREKDTQYLQTLRTWLLLERNIPDTSQALIIHRTTLLYRLKKIQGLISSNLDDPWQRLNLVLSFWILDNAPGDIQK